jgi:hypothetical protein
MKRTLALVFMVASLLALAQPVFAARRLECYVVPIYCNNGSGDMSICGSCIVCIDSGGGEADNCS